MRNSQIRIYGSDVLFSIMFFIKKESLSNPNLFSDMFLVGQNKIKEYSSDKKISQMTAEKLNDYILSFRNVAFNLKENEIIVNASYLFPVIKYFIVKNNLTEKKYGLKNYISCHKDYFEELENFIMQKYSSKEIYLNIIATMGQKIESINKSMTYWACNNLKQCKKEIVQNGI